MNKKHLLLILVVTIMAVVGIIWINQTGVSKTIHGTGDEYITIAGTNIFLFFEAQDIPRELQKFIASDLERCLSGATQVVWEAKSNAEEIRGILVTHSLKGWRYGDLPYVIKYSFGAGMTEDGMVKVIICRELIDAYKDALALVKKRPVMFARLDEFLVLLSDRKRLEQLAEDRKAVRRMCHFINETPPSDDQYYKDIVKFADMRIYPHSVLRCAYFQNIDLNSRGAKTHTQCAVFLLKGRTKHIPRSCLSEFMLKAHGVFSQ